MDLTPEILSNIARLCVEKNPGSKLAAIKDLRSTLGRFPGTGTSVLGLREAIDLTTTSNLDVAKAVLARLPARARDAGIDYALVSP